MTHLTWRNGRAYFRYRLPPELRAIPKPKHWPTELQELVSESNRERLKHELSQALGTRDEREAKRRAAVEVARVEGIIQRAREFLVNGPRKNLSSADIKLMADRFGAGLIVSDMDLRKSGIGLELPSPGRSLTIKLGRSSPSMPTDRDEPGLTKDDLGLLQFAVAKIKPEVNDALARQRPTQFIKEAARKALNEAGVELEASSPELRELELAFLAEYSKALEVWETRNAGRLVPNPVIPDAQRKVPTIQSAFESWKAGSGTRGESLPAMGAIEEASHAVRRFVELHGNLFVSDITAAHARSFRDAVAKVPPRLPVALQRLPLPKLIEAKNLPPGRPSAATVNKKLTLLSAILHKAVRDHGLKAGWHNPFEGLKIQEARGAKNRRSTFNSEDLRTLLGQVDGVTKTSWQRFYVGPGYVDVDDFGKVTATEKWDEVVDEVSDTLDPRLYHLAKADALYVVDGTFYLWCLPPELVTSGRTITIYSYLANGALMLAYLRRLGVQFEHVRDLVAERRFRETAKKLIAIKTIRSLEGMSFSYTGQTTKKESKEERSKRAKKVAKALMNIRQRELADTPLETVMITCAKENWFHKPGSERSKAGPYAANSRMFNKVNWVANTTRGTNQFIHCRTAIYLWDQHLNPYVRRWLGLGDDRLADDQYAITELIQWLYRTGVRRGEPITVYIPSARMRRLLTSWLEGGDLPED